MNTELIRAHKFWWIAAVGCAVLIVVLVASSNLLRTYAVFYTWKSKQIEILKENSLAGNGLAPLPEQNPDYGRLVAIGPKLKPFLIGKLQHLSAQPYQNEAPYLSSLPRYVAYAVVDVSGWPREDVEKESKHYKSLGDY